MWNERRILVVNEGICIEVVDLKVNDGVEITLVGELLADVDGWSKSLLAEAVSCIDVDG